MVKKRIPSSAKVIKEINGILKSRLYINSLQDLKELTLKRLRKEDRRFVLTSQRVKKLVLTIPEIQVKAKTKKGIKNQTFEQCPICNSSILPLKVKNIFNREVNVGYKCENCSFRTNLNSFSPMRYEFTLKSVSNLR